MLELAQVRSGYLALAAKPKGCFGLRQHNSSNLSMYYKSAGKTGLLLEVLHSAHTLMDRFNDLTLGSSDLVRVKPDNIQSGMCGFGLPVVAASMMACRLLHNVRLLRLSKNPQFVMDPCL